MVSQFPFIVNGTITDSGSANPSGAPIIIRNDRTVETISITTNSSGEYVGDLANLTNGWNVGDQVTVIARFGLEEGESSFVVQDNEASRLINITTSEIVDSSDVSYCTIQEVYNELDGKTTDDISGSRVRDTILRMEGFIDVRTGTSFKSNTITDEFYDSSNENFWASPELKLGLFSSGSSRSDAGLSGGVDSVQLKNKPIISITGLSRNIAGSTETDSFESLTEQTGSSGNYVLDKQRGILTFFDDKPYFGKKRSFKITYAWGLDRDSTDAKMVSKRELAREVCLLLSVRSILTTKVSSSQFSSTDSISLESISISKNATQARNYLDGITQRINEIFDILGQRRAEMGLI